MQHSIQAKPTFVIELAACFFSPFFAVCRHFSIENVRYRVRLFCFFFRVLHFVLWSPLMCSRALHMATDTENLKQYRLSGVRSGLHTVAAQTYPRVTF